MSVSTPDGIELATAIHIAFPGWRGWRTRDGDLAARKGGSPPGVAHARGRSLPELLCGIEMVITAGLPPVLRAPEQAALDVLTAAPAPMRIRAVSDAAGLHLSATTKALTTLYDRGPAARRRNGRTWLYTCAVASEDDGDHLQRGGGSPA